MLFSPLLSNDSIVYVSFYVMNMGMYSHWFLLLWRRLEKQVQLWKNMLISLISIFLSKNSTQLRVLKKKKY